MAHGVMSFQLEITHLAEGRGYNLPMLFPLGKLRRQDISPEKVKKFVFHYRLGEFQSRAEDGL